MLSALFCQQFTGHAHGPSTFLSAEDTQNFFRSAEDTQNFFRSG